jgi:putative hydrolase of the HAD superfamily
MRASDYPNIIFDLGGVILNIDYLRTANAFKALGLKDFDQRYSQLAQTHIFDRFERGEIDPPTFRQGLREAVALDVDDTAIDQAWNAMLLDLPDERLKLLERISNEKRIALLSNTNQIHIDAFHGRLREQINKPDLSHLFGKVYYSFEMGMRKPEPRIFKQVLSEMGLDPEETLFIDDSPQHIVGARSVGLNVHHLRVDRGETITDLFADLLA